MKKPSYTSKFHGPITSSFLQEVNTFQLHYMCEQCAFFDDENALCVHGYPDTPHRASYFSEEPLDKVLVFCRDFEVGGCE